MTDSIICRFCRGKNCENGDDCADCGCPKCGMPGARFENRGFCNDHACDWEAVPGAHDAWTYHLTTKSDPPSSTNPTGELL